MPKWYLGELKEIKEEAQNQTRIAFVKPSIFYIEDRSALVKKGVLLAPCAPHQLTRICDIPSTYFQATLQNK